MGDWYFQSDRLVFGWLLSPFVVELLEIIGFLGFLDSLDPWIPEFRCGVVSDWLFDKQRVTDF